MNEERLFIVYTDIVGHTRLIDRVGVGFRPMRRVHDELFRQAVEAAGGAYCCVGTGDGFYAGFTSVGAALDTALTFRRRLAATDWDQYLSPKLQGPENAVKARVGIHCGLVKVRYAGTQPADFDGLPRNTCDKLCALAKGNQVVVSREVWDEVRLTYTNAGELDHAAFGFFKPKDCKEVVEVFGVAESGCEVGPCPEQPAEYGAVLFAYIDEAMEMLDRMGDERFEQQFLRLEGLLQDVTRKHAPAAFVKRLGKDGFLVATDSDVEIARVGLELRRGVYGAYQRRELTTILKMGADCGSVHYAYGARGREDVRDQPCNVAAKIAGKLSNRWQFLISDRVKRNAHARLSDRDEYQWVSLGRRDPVGAGEGFEVIDLRDTRIRTGERPVLWVDLSHVLIQLGGMAEALKKGLTERLVELFGRAAGSCKVRPLRADHPAGFFAVFDDPLDAFDTAVDFHAACVAEPWEKTMAGLKRRHKRDSLARVGLMLGQVSSGVVNGWTDTPEGPGVEAARQMMSAQEGAGITVLVGNSMRSAVEAGIVAMRGLGPEARAGRPPASFTPVRTSADWPEAAFGKVWGVEADSRAIGRVSPIVKWGLLAAAVALVSLAGMVVYRTQQTGTGLGSITVVNQSPQLTSAIKVLQQAVSESGNANAGGTQRSAFRARVLADVQSAGDSLVAESSSKPAVEQERALPEMQRLTALATLLGKSGVFRQADEAAAATAYAQASGDHPLRSWRTAGTSPEAWANNVATLYSPYAPAPRAGKDTWKQARDAAARTAAKNVPEARRLELSAKSEELKDCQSKEWETLAFVAANRKEIDRVATKLDNLAASLTGAAAEVGKLAVETPKPAAAPSAAEVALRDRLRAKIFPDGTLEQNRYWVATLGPWAEDQLRDPKADAVGLTRRVDEIEAALKETSAQAESQPRAVPPAALKGDWAEAFSQDFAVRRRAARESYYTRLGELRAPNAAEIKAIWRDIETSLKDGDERNAASLVQIQSAAAAMNAGAPLGDALTNFGGPAETLADWYVATRDLALKELNDLPAVSSLAHRLAVMFDLSKAMSLGEVRDLLRAAQAQPEVVSAAWDRLAEPGRINAARDAAWLTACAEVLERAQPNIGGDGWPKRIEKMQGEAVERVATALSTPEALDSLGALDEPVGRIAKALAPGVALEERLNAVLDGTVKLGRILWRLDLAAARMRAGNQALNDQFRAEAVRLLAQVEAMGTALPEGQRAAFKRLQEAFACQLAGGGAPGGKQRDFARLGPAVNKGRWWFVGPDTTGDKPPVVRYEYRGNQPEDLAVAHGATLGVNALEFRMLEGPGGAPLLTKDGDPIYLCTTAVSVGVLMIQSDPRTGDFVPGSRFWGTQFSELKDVSGPIGWSIGRDERFGLAEQGRSIAPPKLTKWLARAQCAEPYWIKLGASAVSYFPAAVAGQADNEPSPQSPLQMVRPDMAMCIARSLGARLPTDAEFEAAFDMESRSGSGNTSDPGAWNLRDQSLRETELHLRGAVRGAITSVPTLRSNARVSDFRVITDDWYASDDGAVLFMPVAKGVLPRNYLFYHLVGNVATYTFPDPETVEASLKDGPDASAGAVNALLKNRAPEFHIVGRSALSAKTDSTSWRSAQQVALRNDPRELGETAFGDVGLRLAFTASAKAADAAPCAPTLDQALSDMRKALRPAR